MKMSIHVYPGGHFVEFMFVQFSSFLFSQNILQYRNTCRIIVSWQGSPEETRPQLLKSWIALSTGLITVQRISVRETYCAIQRIEIYRMDSITHLLNNCGQKANESWASQSQRSNKSMPGFIMTSILASTLLLFLLV